MFDLLPGGGQYRHVVYKPLYNCINFYLRVYPLVRSRVNIEQNAMAKNYNPWSLRPRDIYINWGQWSNIVLCCVCNEILTGISLIFCPSDNKVEAARICFFPLPGRMVTHEPGAHCSDFDLKCLQNKKWPDALPCIQSYRAGRLPEKRAFENKQLWHFV